MTYSSKISIPENTRLWVEWQKIAKKGSGIVELHKIRMHGPIFNDCEKMEENGFIFIDLTKHFLIILPKPYFVKMEWEGLYHQDSSGANVKKIFLKDDDLGLLNKISNKDKLLLDCSGHHTRDVEVGYYKPAFDAILFNQYNEPYKFE